MPTKEMGPCAVAIAVEPVAGHEIPKHRQLHVLHAAVAPKPGVVSMTMYNRRGVSSSLAAAAKDDWWNSGRNRGELRLVPVITMSSILNAIP